jgi:branched-subunit amino acid transport protein
MRTEIVIIILGMAAVTFLTRFGAQAVFRQTGIPPWFNRWFKHVPTGILTALILPSLILPQGRLDLSYHNPYLIAGVITALVAYYVRSVPLTMGAGLATIILLRIL